VNSLAAAIPSAEAAFQRSSAGRYIAAVYSPAIRFVLKIGERVRIEFFIIAIQSRGKPSFPRS